VGTLTPESDMLADRSHDDVLDDRFVVRELRDRDGLGELYLAYDQASGDRVALKVFRPATMSPERFAREAAILEGLQHPGIVRHLAHGTTPGGAPYLATQWVEGEDLAERMGRERLTLTEVVALGIALARALGAAHAAGVMHRDLKPRSVMLHGFRVGGARLIDFGPGGSDAAARGLARPGAGLAARGYTAPERVLRDPLRIGPRADLFSLGCVLYEALADAAPFEAHDPEEVFRRILFFDPRPLAECVQGLPVGLATLVEQLLEKDPDERPLDGAAVARALETIPVATRRDGVRMSVLRGAAAGMVRVSGEPVVDIGRHPSATLALPDASAARFHCELVRDDNGRLVVRDLGSHGGLAVDGERVASAELRDGAVLAIGRSLVRVERASNADCGPTELERALSGDTNVLLEGEGEPRAFAERLHAGGARRRGPYAAVYGSAFRARDLAHLSGGTLLLMEPETLSNDAQHDLADFAETRLAPTSRGRVHADVRLIAHGAVDLRVAVNGRRFLSDLFKALAGARLRLPV
jgi:hypothetical protein